MNLIQLEYFIKTAHTGSVTAASRQLNISQPAVSKQIRLLEEEFECCVFKRRHGKMELTADGERLYRNAGEIIALASRLKDEFEYARGHVSGKLIVGCGPLSARYLIPDLIDEMLRQYPRVEISICETVANHMTEILTDSSADLVIGMADPSEEPEFENLFTSRMVAVCAANSPLARKSVITREDILSGRLIAYTEHSHAARMVNLILGTSAVNPVLRTHQAETMLAYAARGTGLAIIPEYIVDFAKFPNIAAVRLWRDYPVEIGIKYDPSRPLSPSARTFIRTAHNFYDNNKECFK